MALRCSQLRIEVAGIIASGKTTFASIFRDVADADVVLEAFNANPFYDAFYRDPANVAFETEISFLLLHCYEARKSPGPVTVCDFATILDRAYSRVTLDSAQAAVFEVVWRHLADRCNVPTLLIHLTCTADAALERIRRRGRKSEQSITRHYLESLDRALRTEIVNSERPYLAIDSETVDFRFDEHVRRELATIVYARLAEI